MSKATLEQKAKRERHLAVQRHISRTDNIAAIADNALDGTLEASFPASDPPAMPWTRVGTPQRPK